MCGIYGIVGSTDNTTDKIFNALSHRGPDGRDSIKFDEGFLAHTRLAIIDPLPEANQPFISCDGNLALVFNGEIYNYKELIDRYELSVKTKSDTEVILCLYEMFGENCVELLDGMFALGIWDFKKKKLFLARDRAGEKPLYYSYINGKFIFSSTIEAILSSNIFSFALNKQAIWDFFTFLWVPEPATIFENIYALLPGRILIFSEDEKIKIYSYANKFGNFNNNKEKIENSIKNSVEKSIQNRLISDVPIGAFLSGGIDSSIVCAVASEFIKDLPTFSVGFKDNFDEYTGYADETPYALIMSKILGTKHTSIYVDANDFLNLLSDFVNYCDQPFGVVSGLGVLAVAKEAKKQGIKVLLSGDGADEIFGGYGWHVKIRYSDINIFSEDKPKGWHYYATESQKNSFLSKAFFDNCESSTRLLVDEPLTAEPKEFLKHDLEFYLKNEMMTKLDRMTMAYGVEGRATFVSPLLLDFADKISYEDLLPTEETKYLLKNAFSDILPENILSRPKHGFNPPIDYWIKGKWSTLLDVTLDKNSALYRMGILNENGIKAFKDALTNEERLGNVGFCFIVLNMWLCELEKKGYRVYV